MQIGNIIFKDNLFLAPMAGVSDIGFRSVCTDFGAEMCYTEMVSAKALYYKSEKTNLLLTFPKNAKYKAVQIFGNDADIMAEIVKSFDTKYDIIDINMGCPAPKIFKNGEGSFLMSNEKKAYEIISKCVKASKVPITVKFRSGINDETKNYLSFAKMCEKAGASAITVHPRTREQYYSGKSDYSVLKEIVENVTIPVIGSGDVTDFESYKKMLETGVSAVMIGRASLGNPFIFADLLGKEYPYGKYEAILKQIEYLKQYYEDSYINTYMRKHFIWYLQGKENAKEIKRQIVQSTSLENSLMLLKTVLD